MNQLIVDILCKFAGLLMGLKFILTGFFGLVYWPPPSMAPYEDLITVTGIPGIPGCVIRMVVGTILISSSVHELPKWRAIGAVPALVVAGLLVWGFHASGQGLAFGSWLEAFALIIIYIVTQGVMHSQYEESHHELDGIDPV